MICPILNVTNIDTSVKFYTEKLGFAHNFSMPNADGVNTFAFVSLGEAVSIGFNLDPDLTDRGKGVDFMIYVDDTTDIDTLFNTIKARGVSFEAEIADQYWGDRTFSLHDPDNYRLTLAKQTKTVPNEDIEAIMRGEKSPT